MKRIFLESILGLFMPSIASGSGFGGMNVPTGINTGIVQTLKAYNRALPVDFVARYIGRQPYEIQSDIKNLERMGVIQRIGENISLVKT
jgi:hypothetical protein